MAYDGRFRFRAIEPRRFYDAVSLIFISGVVTVVGAQLILIVIGKPGLRVLFGL